MVLLLYTKAWMIGSGCSSGVVWPVQSSMRQRRGWDSRLNVMASLVMASRGGRGVLGDGSIQQGGSALVP